MVKILRTVDRAAHEFVKEGMSPLVTSFLTVVTSIVLSFVSARLGIYTALRSKWWDKKEKAYSDIIEALYGSVLYYREAQRATYSEIFSATVTEEKYLEHSATIEKLATVGEFYICKGASDALKQFLKRERISFTGRENPMDLLDEEISAHKEVLESFRKIALADLGVQRKWWQKLFE